ncbi:nucleotidyltransferase domain-containing protein [Rubrivirga sp. S365]|uniref:Nucleotidyltransferase domain-containing protein n=1 Tax=Rubrivirga litoralis TaxID=3075598 RepID=A0ABU3BP73_9BACT|nr:MULTISPECIES: nucleotidyltransferase domain-containing protein [unclassified Rubrivirga]MDT0631068.1 nucleotidyltransferase domain-containing protein [Rubrivirga sp. F394]MDT7855420.1 nucleotidyltransferase domain-containing protein [Rubrivirga sp. S365]
MATPPLRQMIAAVAEAVRPRRVVLFGSHAAGGAGEDSDVDLLVIEDGPLDEAGRADEMVRLWEALAPFRVPADILVYTEEEVAQWGATTNHAVAHALREGTVVYERP